MVYMGNILSGFIATRIPPIVVYISSLLYRVRRIFNNEPSEKSLFVSIVRSSISPSLTLSPAIRNPFASLIFSTISSPSIVRNTLFSLFSETSFPATNPFCLCGIHIQSDRTLKLTSSLAFESTSGTSLFITPFCASLKIENLDNRGLAGGARPSFDSSDSSVVTETFVVFKLLSSIDFFSNSCGEIVGFGTFSSSLVAGELTTTDDGAGKLTPTGLLTATGALAGGLTATDTGVFSSRGLLFELFVSSFTSGRTDFVDARILETPRFLVTLDRRFGSKHLSHTLCFPSPGHHESIALPFEQSLQTSKPHFLQ
mmetsp:Transcript_21476/g.31948  ORF Transcript_21476/g.31948 Transcript_21476/m.31948 type:complete len:313 (-) Transcript_21476:1237-2175(-)